MPAYTSADSSLLGGIPARTELELQKFFDDAADEMDSIIGGVFETPVVRNLKGLPLGRPAQLTLARINRYLATGRYILAVAASGEEDSLHSYGARLVREALDALRDIAIKRVLFDAYEIPDPEAESKGPRIYNAEERSNVDAFYEAGTGPDNMFFGTPWPYGIGRLEAGG